MLYRPNGATSRLSKWEDEVYVDASNMATDWLPVTGADVVNIMTSKASLQSTNNPAVFKISKYREFAPATIALELKRGGQSDSEAWTVEDWQNAGVQASVSVGGYGFVRLRLVSYTQPFMMEGGPNTVSMGIALRLVTSRTEVANRPL